MGKYEEIKKDAECNAKFDQSCDDGEEVCQEDGRRTRKSRREKIKTSSLFPSLSLSLCSLFLVRFGNVYKVEGGGGGDVDV